MPEKPEFEVEISVQKHTEWLQKEYKKEGQEMMLVDQLMDITLFHRRKLVVSEQKDVESILSDYPC